MRSGNRQPPAKKGSRSCAHQVFVSHAGIDTWIASQIAQQIEKAGAVTFLDEAHIAAGEDFEERILASLIRSNELLVLLTPWALERRYVWAEIGAAWGRKKLIVVLLHGLTPEEIEGRGGVPVIKRRNLLPLNDFPKYLEQLRQRLNGKRKLK